MWTKRLDYAHLLNPPSCSSQAATRLPLLIYLPRPWPLSLIKAMLTNLGLILLCSCVGQRGGSSWMQGPSHGRSTAFHSPPSHHWLSSSILSVTLPSVILPEPQSKELARMPHLGLSSLRSLVLSLWISSEFLNYVVHFAKWLLWPVLIASLIYTNKCRYLEGSLTTCLFAR